MHRGSIHQRHPKAPFKSKPCGFGCYTVLAPVSKCYPLLMGRLPTCYSPVRHSSFSDGASSGGKRSVRLACIRHAASVRPEPGSNSQFENWAFLICSRLFACELTSLICLDQTLFDPHTAKLCSVFKVPTCVKWRNVLHLTRLFDSCQQLSDIFFLPPRDLLVSRGNKY